MKCRMFALSLALGALLCLAPSPAALEPQPEVPAPDTAAASQTDTPAAPAEEAAPDAAEPAGQALTEEVTKEVTVTVEVPILPEKPPIQISRNRQRSRPRGAPSRPTMTVEPVAVTSVRLILLSSKLM